MADVTLIKPAKGSGRFVDDDSAKVYQVTKDSSGREIKRVGEAFKKEKFPRSNQMVRPKYSNSRRLWLVDMTPEDLNKLVPDCLFKYPKKHNKGGQYIEKSILHDPEDAFFNHRKLRVLLSEGEGAIRNDDPVHRIVLAGMRMDPEFQVGNTRGAQSSRVKYIVANKAIDTANAKSEMEEHDEALDLFKAKNHMDKKKIARALHLPISDDIEPDDLTLLLRRKIDENEKITSGQGFRATFIAACQMSEEDLNVRDMLERAKRYSILRKKTDGYMFMGQYIGKRIDTVERYFLNPDNQETFLHLEKMIKEAEHNRK